MKAIIGSKIGMTRIFDNNGLVIPVTLVKVGPCAVTLVKDIKNNKVIELGYGNNKKINKSIKGHTSKAKIEPRFIIGFKNLVSKGDKEYQIGDVITSNIFQIGDFVKATGISKGKGFAGTVKRHGFTTGPKTHGSNNYRQPGSIGSTWPEHVIKGRRMCGHMGAKKITTEGLEIIDIDNDKSLLVIKGSIPGPNKSRVIIRN